MTTRTEGEAGPAAHVAWAKGGEGGLVALEGDRVRLRSTISSAPGSRLAGALVATGKPLRLKVARCRRVETGGFEIEGRLIDATREVREALLGLLQPGARGEA